MSGIFSLSIMPSGMRVISDLSKASGRVISTLNRSLRKITTLNMRESQKAFETKQQAGGVAWEPNYGDEPGGYAWFKREVLGLADPSQGYINGELRNSLAQEIDLFPKLESRVGTTKDSGKEFSEGGTSGEFFVKDHQDRWWRFPGGAFPGRPFLPETAWAESKAAEIMREEMRAFAEEGWKRTISDVASLGGLI